ncbi:MAG TPA: peptide synthetase, partial [Roseovarius nubinhibens]|nr:peptide synthetase [Roseovarius nubinhibens]
MPIDIRRTLTTVQTTHKEGWKEVAEPTTLVAAMAIIGNPWYGRGHVEDLSPEIREHGPV